MAKIISVTELARNAASIAREIETEGTIYRITRGGRGSVVLVGEAYFDGWMAAIEEMQRPDWREVLAETQRDVAAGRGRTLEAVVKERELEGSAHASSRRPARRAPRSGRKKGRQRLR